MYRKILLPIDLTHLETYTKVLSIAVEMAQTGKGEIRAITVVPPVNAMISNFLPDDVVMTTLHENKKLLKMYLSENIPADVNVSLSVVEGQVYPEILREAKDSEADVIVLASHQPELSDYLLGSNAAKVVRHAPISVLVVRE